DILRLWTALELPAVIVLEERHKFLGVEALCVLLKRLAFPNRLSDLSPTFGRSPGELSWIVSYLVGDLKDRYAEILKWDADRLTPQLLKQFCGAIHDTGSPLRSVFGFIDGTDRRILRPTHHQRKYYSGQKRQHCLKYQGVVSPDGIIIHLAGPFLASCPSWYVLILLRVVMAFDMLLAAFGPAHEPYQVYGDPAYLPGNGHLAGLWKLVHLSDAQQEFNSRNSAVRVSIEWAWEKPATLFAFLNYYRNLRVELSPVGLYYSIGILLTNAHTCLYGSQTGERFGLTPPTLEEYLKTE
ncbi:hypothetical protein M427DRAFT_100807, partial [Gonapodya prolifera JEL478]